MQLSTEHQRVPVIPPPVRQLTVEHHPNGFPDTRVRSISRQDALRNLAHRTDLEEVRNLVALLVQTDRFGTSIGQALRVHADSMRTTRRLKAEELAAKLPVKLLIPLIFFIFPSMFIVLIGPACIKMVRVLFPVLAGH